MLNMCVSCVCVCTCVCCACVPGVAQDSQGAQGMLQALNQACQPRATNTLHRKPATYHPALMGHQRQRLHRNDASSVRTSGAEALVASIARYEARIAAPVANDSGADSDGEHSNSNNNNTHDSKQRHRRGRSDYSLQQEMSAAEKAALALDKMEMEMEQTDDTASKQIQMLMKEVAIGTTEPELRVRLSRDPNMSPQDVEALVVIFESLRAMSMGLSVPEMHKYEQTRLEIHLDIDQQIREEQWEHEKAQRMASMLSQQDTATTMDAGAAGFTASGGAVENAHDDSEKETSQLRLSLSVDSSAALPQQQQPQPQLAIMIDGDEHSQVPHLTITTTPTAAIMPDQHTDNDNDNHHQKDSLGNTTLVPSPHSLHSPVSPHNVGERGSLLHMRVKRQEKLTARLGGKSPSSSSPSSYRYLSPTASPSSPTSPSLGLGKRQRTPKKSVFDFGQPGSPSSSDDDDDHGDHHGNRKDTKGKLTTSLSASSFSSLPDAGDEDGAHG